jgi:hypothetical protein
VHPQWRPSTAAGEAKKRGASWAARGEEGGATGDLGRGRPEAWDSGAPWGAAMANALSALCSSTARWRGEGKERVREWGASWSGSGTPHHSEATARRVARWRMRGAVHGDHVVI